MKRRRMFITMLATFLVGVSVTFATENATATKTTTPTVKKLPIKGNTKSKIYHKPSCKYYKAKNTTVVFKTEAEAKKAGYRPCKKCFAKKTAKKKVEKKTKKQPVKI